MCDVSDNTSVLNVTRKAVNSFGKIDILINNAAIWRCFTAFNETDIDVWKKLIDVNIMGTVYFTKAVIDQMIANNYGRIIFVTKRLFLSFSLIGVNIRQF